MWFELWKYSYMTYMFIFNNRFLKTFINNFQKCVDGREFLTVQPGQKEVLFLILKDKRENTSSKQILFRNLGVSFDSETILLCKFKI